MAITSQTSSIEYDGNDSDVTAYTVPFLFFSNAHLKVTVTTAAGVATVLELTTDYTVAGANNPSGGTVVTEVAYDDTHTVLIERVVPLTQPFVYEEGGRLPMKTLEKNFDTIAMQAQQVQRVVDVLPTVADVDQKIVDAQLDGPTADSVLALIEGQTLEPGTLTLPDFADSTPPANALGMAGGRLALGDGTTVAGNPLTPRRVAGMKICDLNGTNKTSARFAVVGIPLTAAEVVNGALVNISGTVKLLFNADFYTSEEPLISATIGFAHNAHKTAVKTKWLKYNCVPTGTEIVFVVTNCIAGDFQISTTTGDQVQLVKRFPSIISERWGGVAGATFSKTPTVFDEFTNPDSTGATTEETADTIWLSVEIVMGASGTNGYINFAVVYDIDTAVTLP